MSYKIKNPQLKNIFDTLEHHIVSTKNGSADIEQGELCSKSADKAVKTLWADLFSSREERRLKKSMKDSNLDID